MVNLFASQSFSRILWWGGISLFAATGFFNLGIMAIDDYAFVISQVIPAQKNTSLEILKNTGLWHPIVPFSLHLFSQTAFRMGIEDPYHQLQFVLVTVALSTFLIQSRLLPRFFDDPVEKNLALFLLSFYFVSPLLFTRPMIESIAAPLLLLSAYFGNEYYRKGTQTALWLAILTLSIAALIRYQTGICMVALVFLVALRKSLRDTLHLLLALIAGFVLSGAIDLLLTGEFHGSLKGYLNYNLYHSSANHGTQPIYTFILLFIALTLPPSLFSTYAGFQWRSYFKRLMAPAAYFFIFLVSHTLAPHKEERFMIPVLPLFFLLLVPLLSYWFRVRQNPWRIVSFFTLNCVLLLLTSFNTPQSNIIGLVRFLDKTPQFKRIYSWGDTLVIFPTAYSNRALEHIELKGAQETTALALNCSELLAIRQAQKDELSKSFSTMTQLAAFTPGPLESLLVRLNPVRNARRGTILVFGRKGCP